MNIPPASRRRLLFILSLLLAVTLAADTGESPPITRGAAAAAPKKAVVTANQPPAKEWWEQDGLTGDWCGGRTELKKTGADFSANITTDLLGNPTGGRDQGFEAASSFDLGTALDLEKLAGLTGSSFHGNMIWRAGKNLSYEYIGNILTVAQLYGGPNVRLYNLYWKQQLLDDCLTLKAGRLGAFDDFAASSTHWNYINNGFDGNPKGIFLDLGAFGNTVYPTSSWGFFAQGQPREKDWYAQAGLYGLNSRNGNNSTHGLNFTFDFDQGAAIFGQGGYRLNMKPDLPDLPGLYSMGYFVSTDRYSTYDIPQRTECNDGGMYWLLQQMVYREPGDGNRHRQPAAWGYDAQEGLSFWSTIVYLPSDNVNPFPMQVNLGAIYQGPIPGRDQDFAAIGWGWIEAGDALRRYQSSTGAALQDHEMVLELNYRCNLTRFFYAQPVAQYLISPGADGRLPDAVVLGAQLGLTF